MKVKDLITLLQAVDQDLTVTIWDCYDDKETDKIILNVTDHRLVVEKM